MKFSALLLNGGHRKNGNSDRITQFTHDALTTRGASVTTLTLRDEHILQCDASNHCVATNRCHLDDAMQDFYQLVCEANIIVMVAPAYFFAVPAALKIFMERCQLLWARKYIHKEPIFTGTGMRAGGIICFGAQPNERHYDGMVTSAEYFFKSIDVPRFASLTMTGIDALGDADSKPDVRARVDSFIDSLQNA